MELLTKKCKEDFEVYYIKFARKQKDVGDRYYDETIITQFYRSPLSMQWGVLEDFFDSKGIRINIVEAGLLEFNVRFYLYDGDLIKSPINQPNRPKARKEAINTANELYNENNK